MREAIRSYWAKVPSPIFAVRADDDEAPAAMIAGSVQLLSLDPPLVSWSIRKHARHAATFRQARQHAFAIFEEGRFGMLAEILADPSVLGERFAFSDLDDGTFTARVKSEIEAGDHWVFVLEIDVIRPPRECGLVYVEREVRRLS